MTSKKKIAPTEPTATSLLVGNPFGVSEGEHFAKLPPEARDARKLSLLILKKYLCEQTICIPGDNGGKDIEFKISSDLFYIEPPKKLPEPAKYPSIGVQPISTEYMEIGLGDNEKHATLDMYGKGTCLYGVADYNETFKLIVMCNSAPQRTAIKRMIEMACIPTEALAGIRFRMPDYFDETCTFTFQTAQHDDGFVVNGRYDLDITFLLYVDVVRLVYVNRLEPIIRTETT